VWLLTGYLACICVWRIVMDTLNTFYEFKPFSTFFLVVTDLQGSLSVCFTLTQYVSNFQYFNYTPRPCFTSICFMRFCFNASCQFTPLLNLYSIIFSLMSFGWLICVYLSLCFSYGPLIFYLCLLDLCLIFKECNCGIKQGLGVPVILCLWP